MSSTVPVEGLRSRKKREMREKLIVSARTLFSKHGFEKTTIEAIATMADVSKPTVFNYFPSKAALLHELVIRADQNFVQVAEEARQQETDTARRMEYFFLHLGSLSQLNLGLTRVLLVEAIKSMDGSEGAALPHRFAQTEKALAKLLRDGVKRGDVRTDYSTQLLTQLIVGAYTNILLLWLADPSNYPLDLKLRQSARFLGEAIAVPSQ